MSAEIVEFPKARRMSVMEAIEFVEECQAQACCVVCGGYFPRLPKAEIAALRRVRDPSMCMLARLSFEGDRDAMAVLVEYVAYRGDPDWFFDGTGEAS